MANTLLQHWLINYFRFHLEKFSSSITPQQTVCDKYKQQLVDLLLQDYESDRVFMDIVYNKLRDLIEIESDLYIENNRGDGLCELLRHLKWLISPKVAHLYYGHQLGVVDVFTDLKLIDCDITSFLKEKNTEICLKSIARFEVYILKRNIAEYLITKLFDSKYNPSQFEFVRELPAAHVETLLRKNILILKSFADELVIRDIKDQRDLMIWHNDLESQVVACLSKLSKARDDIIVTWLKDMIWTKIYQMFGWEGAVPNTASMDSIAWVCDNIIRDMDFNGLLKSYKLREIITHSFIEVSKRPEVYKATVKAQKEVLDFDVLLTAELEEQEGGELSPASISVVGFARAAASHTADAIANDSEADSGIDGVDGIDGVVIPSEQKFQRG